MGKKESIKSKKNGAKAAGERNKSERVTVPDGTETAVVQDSTELGVVSGMADGKEKGPSKPFPIVGVGASAGGLEALKAMLGAMPVNTGMAFVLIQHMDPTHESVLSKLLALETPMPVAQVADGMEVEPNRVYVIPPNFYMTIRGGILRLTARPKGIAGHMPVDYFLSALAQDQKNIAIGVILSGIGTDGTHGLKAIKAEGGITFAQMEETAKFPGMPQSAILSGSVDFILPVSAIVKELSEIAKHPYIRIARAAPTVALPGEHENGNFARVLQFVRAATGVDFSYYKPSTIRRRIARRMFLQKAENLGQYIEYIEEHPGEAEALFEDILINVTGFFREPETFESLKKTVFPKILEGAGSEPIRIWVPGCSSGEEAYSIAIVLSEFLSEMRNPPRIQIFGTDISMPAIDKARQGIYPEASVAEMSSQRLNRFFTKVEGGYQISRAIRERCVFSRHDLAKDAPFSKLDLISCRNVLIYFGPLLQKRVMSIFHYALKPDCFLLLGQSESISAYSTLFAITDRKHRLYSRQSVTEVQALPDLLALGYENFSRAGTRLADAHGGRAADWRKEAERVLLDRYVPPTILINKDLQILHFQGDTGPYLKPSPGAPSFELTRLIRSELLIPIRKAIAEAKKSAGTVCKEGLRWEADGTARQVDVEVVPVRSNDRKGSDFLILFLEPRPAQRSSQKAETVTPKGADKEEIARVSAELDSTREYLRSITEDYEASNEELRAANEEILSSNEELQSTNEEIETAKEELQSANEELTTLNEELQHRNAELTYLTNDLSNLLVGIEIPIVIVGKDKRIRRFTAPAGSLLNLIPSDVGRPISDIRPNIELPDLDALLAESIRTKLPIEREVQFSSGEWYSLRLRPYRSGQNESESFLIALVDIGSTKRLMEVEAQLRAVARETHDTFAQSLAGLSMKIGDLEHRADSSPALVKKGLHECSQEMQALARDVTEFARRIHPAILDDLGLVMALKGECANFEKQYRIHIRFDAKNVSKSLPQDVALAIYRIAQESLRNIAKHALAKNVRVILESKDSHIALTVRDDGHGYDQKKGNKGMGLGLVSMKERALMVGGKFEIKSEPGKYTLAEVRIPLGPEKPRPKA